MTEKVTWDRVQEWLGWLTYYDVSEVVGLGVVFMDLQGSVHRQLIVVVFRVPNLTKHSKGI